MSYIKSSSIQKTGGKATTRLCSVSILSLELDGFDETPHLLMFHSRPDLVNCGRTLFGKLPTRHQQGDLNYFQPIPGKVAAPWLKLIIDNHLEVEFKMYTFT